MIAKRYWLEKWKQKQCTNSHKNCFTIPCNECEYDYDVVLIDRAFQELRRQYDDIVGDVTKEW